ncbi:hypothetical protein MSAN_01898100 [Mycena sanguinolenta]|uniref:Uncharacterized protein n=1 Tax=Mycena sanguinolenta TaxID=230812 RepID=A0A8H6XRW8_9AGAR|nr:hypothetical protein MSAN_01898100 [Mycena sanguinolenta]
MDLDSQPADNILDSGSERTLKDHESAPNTPLVDKPESKCEAENAPPSPHANSEFNPRLALAFGAHNSFFVENGQSWMYHPPSRILKTITFAHQSGWKNLKIARVYGVSLSDNHGFYLAYKSGDGATMRVFVCPKLDRRCPRFGKASRDLWHSNQTALSNLTTWVSSHINTNVEIQNTYVVFGPQYSYVAKSANHIIWHNLPTDLETLIQSKRSKDPSCLPAQVTLGWRGAWAAIWPDGTHGMDLQGHYPMLEENMRNSDQPLSFIALDPFQPDQFISYFGKIGLVNKGPVSLLEMLQVYQQQRADRANIPAEMRQTAETTVKTWRIEPKTSEPMPLGTLKQIEPEGSKRNATAEKKKISTETKVVVGVMALAVGCVVM